MSIKKAKKSGIINSKTKFQNKCSAEDTTECGEFISTFYQWLTIEEQKHNANYLANIENMNQIERENERFKGI